MRTDLHQLLKLVSPSSAAVIEVSGEMLEAFGSQLSERDQTWLTANLTGFPAFLRTEAGNILVNALVDTYRKKVETVPLGSSIN